MALEWVKIGRNEKLKPGDRLMIKLAPRFAWLGKTVNAYTMAARIEKFESDPRFDVKRWNYLDDGIQLEIDVIGPDPSQPPLLASAVITAGVIIAALLGIAAIAVSAIVYKIVDRAADSVETPGGAFAASSLALGTVAVAGIILYGIFFKE